jgi:hypothetical protein
MARQVAWREVVFIVKAIFCSHVPTRQKAANKLDGVFERDRNEGHDDLNWVLEDNGWCRVVVELTTKTK